MKLQFIIILLLTIFQITLQHEEKKRSSLGKRLKKKVRHRRRKGKKPKNVENHGKGSNSSSSGKSSSGTSSSGTTSSSSSSSEEQPPVEPPVSPSKYRLEFQNIDTNCGAVVPNEFFCLALTGTDIHQADCESTTAELIYIFGEGPIFTPNTQTLTTLNFSVDENAVEPTYCLGLVNTSSVLTAISLPVSNGETCGQFVFSTQSDPSVIETYLMVNGEKLHLKDSVVQTGICGGGFSLSPLGSQVQVYTPPTPSTP